MKKIKTYKGYIIAVDVDGMHYVYTSEEYAYGKGFRSYEWEAVTVEECISFIDTCSV